MGNVSQSEDVEAQSHTIVALKQHIGELEKECTALTRQVAVLQSRNHNLTQQGQRLMGQLRKLHQSQ